MNTTTQHEQESPKQDEIADGYYRAKALGEDEPHVQYGTSNNGNQQIAIEMQLLDLNRNVFAILNFSDAAAPFSLERLQALGWKGGETMAGISTNEVQVRAKTESYLDKEGKTQVSQKFEIMTGNGRFSFQKPMQAEEKRGFFARLNAIANQTPAPANGPPGAKGGYPDNWDAGGAAPAKPIVDLG